MFNLQHFTPDELRALADQITVETDRRERVRVELAFIDERVASLEAIGADLGEQQYVPDESYLPGQVVKYANRRWRNSSGRVLDSAPGKRVDVWEDLTPPPPEPEPEEKPEPEEPTDPA